jgi:iron complex outermembrane receptor protein
MSYIGIPANLNAQDSAIILPVLQIMDSVEDRHSAFNSPFLALANSSRLGAESSIAEQYFFDSRFQFTSYGPGRVSTLSSAGLSSAHAQINWNTIGLNSPLNGVTDLSTIPAFLMKAHHRSDVKVMNSSQDLQARSNANSPFLEGVMSYGSFNTRSVGLGGGVGNERFSAELDMYHDASDNDYEYANDIGERLKQTNGAYDNLHFKLSAHYQLLDNLEINGQVWNGSQLSHIPANIFQLESQARQELDFIRSSLGIIYTGNRFSIRVNQGLISEDLRYEDPNAQIDSRHESLNYQLHTDSRIFLARQSFSLKIKYQYQKGSSTDLISDEYRNILEGMAGWQYELTKNMPVFMNLGFVAYKDLSVPLQFSSGLKYAIGPGSKLSMSFQTRYRIPSLNDLYWNIGGNPDLNMEKGWSSSVEYFGTQKQWIMEAGLQFTRLNDKIIWLPEGAFWTPQNAARVESVDVFAGLGHLITKGDIQIKNKIKYHYIQAEAKEVGSNSLIVKGKQLTYTPLHTITHEVQFKWKNSIELVGRTKYQAEVYTTPNHNSSLDPFISTDLEFRYYFDLFRSSNALYLKIKNLWDSEYYLIESFALPGMHFKAGVAFKLQKQN